MKQVRKWLAVLIAMIIVVTTIDPMAMKKVQAATEESQTKAVLDVTLTDGMVIKSSKKTVTVISRDENGNKTKNTLTFDGAEVSCEWDDDVKTSYVLDFKGKTSGEYQVVVTAGDIEKTYTIQYQKAAEGEFVGYAVMSVDAFTIDKGYIVEPTLVPIYEGETAAECLVRTIEESGYAAAYSGSPKSGFYLQGIQGSNYAKNTKATKELNLKGAKLDEGIAKNIPSLSIDEEDYTEGLLGEFSFNYYSGWMYAVNGMFPNVGFSSYYLTPGDVVRTQFTVYYGAEIGGAGSMGGAWGDMYEVAQKDSLTALIATIYAAKNADELVADTKVKDALAKAYTVLDQVTASQSSVDQAYTDLYQSVYKESVSEISLDQTELQLENQKSEILTVATKPEAPKCPLVYDWSSSDNKVAVVEDGRVTAVGAGTATIKAQMGDAVATCKVSVAEKPITGISFEKKEGTILKNENTILQVSISPANTTEDKTILWKSSDEGVATVTSSGKVTGIAEGTAVITATVGTFTDTYTINVKEVAMEGISLSKEDFSLNKGKTQYLSVAYTPANTTDAKNVTWSSSDTSVATVNTSGRVTAVASGTAIITATVGKFQASVTVNVAEVALEKITLAKRTASVKVGSYISLTRTLYPSDQTDGTAASVFTWDSEDKAVATCVGYATYGKVTGVAAGTTNISIQSKVRNVSANCLVQVVGGSPVVTKSVSFDKKNIEIKEGESMENKAVLTPENGTDPILYESSDEGVATVSKAGTVTGVSEGTARITAYAGAYSCSYEVSVVSKNVKLSFEVSPKDATVFVEDASGNRVNKTNGVYVLTNGESYTYTASKYGYVTQKNTIQAKATTSAAITLEKAVEKAYKQFTSEWSSFRKGEDNSGIVDAKTPANALETDLLWSQKVGTGYGANAAGTPILVGDSLICMQGTKLLKYDAKTGKPQVDASGKQIVGTMVAGSNYNIVSPTYANGMIFVGLSLGRVQAFDAETLESLWVYQDSLSGQSNSPILYSDGYVYTGFWNSETKQAHYVCLSVTDEDTTKTTEAKQATWTDTNPGGFYWAGAYASGAYVYVGTDDGTSSTSPNGKLNCYNKYTGELVDQVTGLVGDVRCSIAYDKETDRMYFTTKGGYLYSVKTNKNGTFVKDSLESLALSGASTSTPSICNGRLYVGVSGSSAFGTSGHFVRVMELSKDGGMSFAYDVKMPGYPQTSGTVSTGYTNADGYNYVYFTYNMTPGGVVVLKDKKGQTEAISEEVFTPSGAMAQYCICSIVANSDGILYYKNDSGYMMALSVNKAYIDDVTVSGGNAVLDKGKVFSAKEYTHEIVVEEGTKEVSLAFKLPQGVKTFIGDEQVQKLTVPVSVGAITVTAVYEKDERSYSFTIREKKANADISMLRVNTSNAYASSILTLTPALQKDVKDYTVTSASTKSFWNLWVKAEDENATVKVYPASVVGASTETRADGSIPVTATNSGYDRYAIYFGTDYTYAKIKVEITAENGTQKKEYFVFLDRVNGTITPTPEVTQTPVATISPVVTTGVAVTITPAVTTGVAVTITPAVTTGVAVTTNPAITISPAITTGVAVTPSPVVSVDKTEKPKETEKPSGNNDQPIITGPIYFPVATITPNVTEVPKTSTPKATPLITATLPGATKEVKPTSTPIATEEVKSTSTPIATEVATKAPTVTATVEPVVIPEDEMANADVVSGAAVASGTSIALNYKNINLYPTQTKTLKAKVTSGAAIQWSVTNKKIAKVSKSGKVTAIKAGATYVKVYVKADKKIAAKCKVVVKKATIKTKKSTFKFKKNKTLKVTDIVKLVKKDKIKRVKVANKRIAKTMKHGKLKMLKKGKTKVEIVTVFGAKKTIVVNLK